MSKKYRFSVDENQLLKTVFAYNPSPDQAKVQEIANKLSVSEQKVYNWFTRERHKLKREKTQPKLFRGKYLALYNAST